jgi:hypothetical protein
MLTSSEVPLATRSSAAKKVIINGTAMRPPPMPEQAGSDAYHEAESHVPGPDQQRAMNRLTALRRDEQQSRRDRDDEHPLEPRHRDTPRHSAADHRAADRPHRDEGAGDHVDGTMEQVGDRTDDCGGDDRDERGGRGPALIEPGTPHQERHHRGSATDGEQSRHPPMNPIATRLSQWGVASGGPDDGHALIVVAVQDQVGTSIAVRSSVMSVSEKALMQS